MSSFYIVWGLIFNRKVDGCPEEYRKNSKQITGGGNIMVDRKQ